MLGKLGEEPRSLSPLGRVAACPAPSSLSLSPPGGALPGPLLHFPSVEAGGAVGGFFVFLGLRLAPELPPLRQALSESQSPSSPAGEPDFVSLFVSGLPMPSVAVGGAVQASTLPGFNLTTFSVFDSGFAGLHLPSLTAGGAEEEFDSTSEVHLPSLTAGGAEEEFDSISALHLPSLTAGGAEEEFDSISAVHLPSLTAGGAVGEFDSVCEGVRLASTEAGGDRELGGAATRTSVVCLEAVEKNK
ncbi:UNVERIFIED_CONTAM: hypothetical protein FKN15_066061 [Acipenser sinensis]